MAAPEKPRLKVTLLGETESTWAACPLIMTLTFPSSYERPLFGAFIVDVVKGVEAEPMIIPTPSCINSSPVGATVRG